MQIFSMVGIAIVGMRGGDDVGDAISGRGTAHGYADVPGFRAVVYFGQDVTVDVDHNVTNTARPVLLRRNDLSRISRKEEDYLFCCEFHQIVGTAPDL